MVSSEALFNTETGFEALGRQLKDAMSTYVGHLKREKLPLPSVAPSSFKPPNVKHPDGVASRMAIIELSQEICAMAMDPTMNLLISSLQFHFCSCLKVAIDLHVYKYVPKRGSIVGSDLALAVGADEALLTRIMRVLTNKHIFAEPEPGHYAHTAMSWMICEPDMFHLLSHRLDEPFRSSSREADALAVSGYHEPHSRDTFGFQLAFDTESNFWDYIANDDPARGRRFARAMRAVNLNTLDVIPEMYPFDELATDGGVVVDVGGGLGQVGKNIMSHYPNRGLKCIVQDKFATNSSMCIESGVQMQRHDFFEPQPVKRAAAYFFRHIFHDWTDCACVKILKHTAEAMDANRSRILICDQVMDEVSPSVPSMLYDIDMMTLFGGKERTLSQWNTLLKAADERLYIRNVATSPIAPTTIIEVRLQGRDNHQPDTDGEESSE